MPNHFHFLLKEIEKGGVQAFLSNFQNSFAKYFNIKTKRTGTLFQRPFKAKHIETDSQLLHISRYIHLNPTTSFIMDFDDLKESSLTSLPHYFNKTNVINKIINTKFIIKLVGSAPKYEEFVKNQIDFQRKLKIIKHILID